MNINSNFLDCHRPFTGAAYETSLISLKGDLPMDSFKETAGKSQEDYDELRECQRIAQRNVKAQSKSLRPASSLKRKTVLSEDFVPSKYSVICGRTQNCYNHTGNRRFRVTVKMFLNEYADAGDKAKKSSVVSKVLDIVRSSSPDGSFVTFEDGRWYEVSDRVAREKIGSQFRDYLHSQYRSSSKAKQARKVQQQQVQQRQNFKQFANVRQLPRHNDGTCSAASSFGCNTSEFISHERFQQGIGQFGFRNSFSF